MPRRKVQPNEPKRRTALPEAITTETLSKLDRARYAGGAHHERSPGDYGFNPPVNPRPHKPVCDGLCIISLRQALRPGTKLLIPNRSLK